MPGTHLEHSVQGKVVQPGLHGCTRELHQIGVRPSLCGQPSLGEDRPGGDLCYKDNWCFAVKQKKKDPILAFFLVLVPAFALCTCPGRFCHSEHCSLVAIT